MKDPQKAAQKKAAEKKLKALKQCKSKLDPYGGHDSKVRKYISEAETAFSSYIKSDNVSAHEVINRPLAISIEPHPDFQAAVGQIGSAISATEATIASIKASEND